jgi:hypothetical protein
MSTMVLLIHGKYIQHGNTVHTVLTIRSRLLNRVTVKDFIFAWTSQQNGSKKIT